MFKTESLELLARKRLRSREQAQDQSAVARLPDSATLLLTDRLDSKRDRHNPNDDPDDVIDPDNREDPDDEGPRLSVTVKEAARDEIYASPAAQTEIPERCPYPPEQSNALREPPVASTAAVGAPAPPDLLDPAVLRTMPPKIAAFMLSQQRDLPRWRSSLPPDGFDDGAWCG